MHSAHAPLGYLVCPRNIQRLCPCLLPMLSTDGLMELWQHRSHWHATQREVASKQTIALLTKSPLGLSNSATSNSADTWSHNHSVHKTGRQSKQEVCEGVNWARGMQVTVLSVSMLQSQSPQCMFFISSLSGIFFLHPAFLCLTNATHTQKTSHSTHTPMYSLGSYTQRQFNIHNDIRTPPVCPRLRRDTKKELERATPYPEPEEPRSRLPWRQ